MNKLSQAALRGYLLVAIAAIVGAAGGYLYYRYVGCLSGTCAITSNPYVSTIYGGVMGGLIGVILAPKAKAARESEEDTHE